MKFETVPTSDAKGSILAHSIRLPDNSVLKKGILIEADEVERLNAGGVASVTVAMPEQGDLPEDEAALRIAEGFSGCNMRHDEARTGRVNFFAMANGVFRVDKDLVDAINRINPGITLATLPDFQDVNEGRMVATVKIIPYCVSESDVDAVKGLDLQSAFSVLPYISKQIGVIFTLTPGFKEAIIEKTRKVFAARLLPSRSEMVQEKQVAHNEEELADAVASIAPDCDMIVIFGGSAISDVRDVVPAAIERSGGTISQFGMPVDPGNLLLLAELNGKPVLGAPGCARSPAENGFDWVLQRLLAGLPVSSADIAGLGVGGLLMETGARPHPRVSKTGQTKVTAVVLAAGQSRRMGKINKLITDFHGKPMVRHVVEAAIGSRVTDVLVVTGHEKEKLKPALEDLECSLVHNENYKEGLSTSLATAIKSLTADSSHVLILLGDMPFVTTGHINAMIACIKANKDRIIAATYNGKRGNPIIWPARFFSDFGSVQGDVGAKHILAANSEFIVEVEIGGAAAHDIDTLETLDVFRAAPPKRD